MSPAQSKDIGAIDSLTRAWTLFIAPWTTEVDEEFGISNHKFLVISGVEGHYEIAGGWAPSVL